VRENRMHGLMREGRREPALYSTEIFNNDITLTSALLDRLLHHAESIGIEARSYRMRDQSGA